MAYCDVAEVKWQLAMKVHGLRQVVAHKPCRAQLRENRGDVCLGSAQLPRKSTRVEAILSTQHCAQSCR